MTIAIMVVAGAAAKATFAIMDVAGAEARAAVAIVDDAGAEAKTVFETWLRSALMREERSPSRA